MTKHLANIVAGTFLLISCQLKTEIVISKNEAITNHEKIATLEEITKHSFPLDSLSSQNIESISTYKSLKDSIFYFSFLNEYKGSIYFYDEKDQDFKFKVTTTVEGTDGVGRISGHYVHSLDSIFVFDRWTSKMSIIDRHGKVLNSFRLNRAKETNSYLPNPFLSCTAPMFFEKGLIYMSGYTTGEFTNENEHNRPVLICYNLSKDSIEYQLSYPKIYQKGNWGAANFRTVFATFNTHKKSIVLSFPADHYAYEFNIDNKELKKHYAGSSRFGDIYSMDQSKLIRDKDKSYEHFGINPSYGSIIYDKFRNVYYRIAEKPIVDYDESMDEKRIKAFSILTLDSTFNIINEKDIPHLTLNRLCFYISENGVCFKCKFQVSDDSVIFSNLRLKYSDQTL